MGWSCGLAKGWSLGQAVGQNIMESADLGSGNCSEAQAGTDKALLAAAQAETRMGSWAWGAPRTCGSRRCCRCEHLKVAGPRIAALLHSKGKCAREEYWEAPALVISLALCSQSLGHTLPMFMSYICSFGRWCGAGRR